MFTIFSFSNSFASVLPAGYTELEYIEATGTQYIDTGIYAQTDSIIEVEYQITQYSTNDPYGWQGVYSDDTALVGYALHVRSNAGQVSYLYGGTGHTVSDIAIANTNRHVVRQEGRNFYIDNAPKDTESESIFTSNSSIKLFRRLGTSFGNMPMKGRIYSAKVWRNGIDLSFNGIPAKTIIDGITVVGMYDLASRVFLANKGTGSFTAGPEVVDSTCNTSATIIGENVCLIDTEPNGDYINVRYNNEQYYLMLDSENDYPIHVGSSNKLKIITNTATYNVHDASVVE